MIHARRILLVDDDPLIRLLVGTLLRRDGHDVTEAADADAARAAFERAPPDLLLMDVLLGESDGITLAETLLAGAATPPTLIFLTGATQEERVARMHAAGAAGVLEKPFDPTSLLDSLQQILAGNE